MKNKKGFTMIELLAVIAIIAVISILIVPNVIKFIEKTRLEAIHKEENSVLDASNILISDYYSDYSIYKGQTNTLNNYAYRKEEKTGTICLKELYNKNYLSEKIYYKGVECTGYINYVDGKGKTFLSCGEYETGEMNSDYYENCNKVKVTLDTDGGNVNPNYLVIVTNKKYGQYETGIEEEEDQIKELPHPERQKYYFLGWYTEKNGGTEVTSSTSVTNGSNHTLYAHWEKETMLDEECLRYFKYKDGTETLVAISGWNKENVNKEGSSCSGKSVIIPERLNGYIVGKITNRSFENAASSNKTKIEQISFPDSLREIEIYSFSSAGIKRIYTYTLNSENEIIRKDEGVFPSQIKRIELRAFAYNNIEKVIFKNNLEFIGNSSFINNKIKVLELPSRVDEIDFGAFNHNELDDENAFIYKRKSDGSEDKTTILSYGGKRKDEIVIPNGVKTIYENSFSYCDLTGYGLKVEEKAGKMYYKLPDGFENVGKNAFKNNRIEHIASFKPDITLAAAIFTNNMVTDDNPFYYEDTEQTIINSYVGLSSNNITIPKNVKVIRENAFEGISIEKLEFEKNESGKYNIEEIGRWAFHGSQIESLELPNSIKKIGPAAFIHQKVSKWICEAKQTNGDNAIFFCETPPVNINNDTIKLVSATMLKDGDKIPSNIKILGSESFCDSVDTDTFIIPNGVIEIDNVAVYYNSIKTVVIPESVKRIGNNVFDYNELENVYICGKTSSKEFESYGTNIYQFTGKKDCIDYKNYEDSIDPNTGKEYSNSCIHWNWPKDSKECTSTKY